MLQTELTRLLGIQLPIMQALGQSLRGLRDGQPAAEIVAEVAEQAASTLRSLAADL